MNISGLTSASSSIGDKIARTNICPAPIGRNPAFKSTIRIRPTVRTPPELARGFVRDLYCYQLRVLRDRLLRQEFPKKEYAGRVIALRDHYRVLSLRAREWVV